MAVEGHRADTAQSLRAVAALAILKVNWDDRQDYIENFVPIVGHCIRESGASVASVPDVQREVRETFGIRVPQGPLKTILGRATGNNLLVREHDVYRPNKDALDGMGLGSEREAVLRQHHQLVQRLVNYANEDLGRSWSEQQAEEALLAYVEVLAEPILGIAVEGEPIVELPESNTEGSVVVSQFALDLCQKEPEAFSYLETIVKGSMLANILYFPEAFSGGRPQLSGVDIYLDTPLLLRVLEYAQEHDRAPARELVELLHRQGAKLKVFEHTLREIEGVLDSAAERYQSGNPDDSPGDVVDFFASEKLSRSDVQALIATVDQRLADNEIEVALPPDQTDDLAVDEVEFERLLNRRIRYLQQKPLRRDLDSLTAIHRIRHGELRRQIERCAALLATTNTALARTSKEFFEPIYRGVGVPLCLVDFRLAAIAWLMDPVQETDLPRKQIVATSYAALTPRDAVWRKYLAEIRKLKEAGNLSTEQVNLLVFSPEARLTLMNATDGSAEAFAEGTVAQVLEHAEASAKAEAAEETRQERAGREKAEARLDRVSTRVRQISGGVARFVAWAVFIVLVAAVVIGTAVLTTDLLPESWSSAIPIAAAFVFVAVLAGLASLVFGVALKDVIPAVEHRLQSVIGPRMQRWLDAREDDHDDGN